MLFSLGKIFFSDEWRAKIGTNDIMLQFTLQHFQTSEKAKNGQFNNCYIKIMYLLFKIQEIFPSRLANRINKLWHLHSLILLT